MMIYLCVSLANRHYPLSHHHPSIAKRQNNPSERLKMSAMKLLHLFLTYVTLGISILFVLANATEDVAEISNFRLPKQKQKYRKMKRGSPTNMADLHCTNTSSEWCTVMMPSIRLCIHINFKILCLLVDLRFF